MARKGDRAAAIHTGNDTGLHSSDFMDFAVEAVNWIRNAHPATASFYDSTEDEYVIVSAGCDVEDARAAAIAIQDQPDNALEAYFECAEHDGDRWVPCCTDGLCSCGAALGVGVNCAACAQHYLGLVGDRVTN